MLNAENIGTPIAVIEGGTLDKKIISLSNTNEEEELILKPFKKICLKTVGGKFRILPNKDLPREVFFFAGQSGCGKSYAVMQYVEKYQKMHKNNPIYLFSEVDDDEKLNKFNVIRIKLDKELLNDGLNYKDFQNSLIIFDDVDGIIDRKIKNEVYDILNSILKMGRHNGATVLVTNHNANDRERTKHIFNECHAVVYYPFGGSQSSMRYMLNKHADVPNAILDYNKTLKSRWIAVKKNYPPHIISEQEIFTIHD